MAEGWFIVPKVRGAGSRDQKVCAKYTGSRWEGTPQVSTYQTRLYDAPFDLRWCLLWVEADPADLATLAAQGDVFEIPLLTETVENPEFNQIRTNLRGLGFPTDWLVRSVTTWQEVIDNVLAMLPLLQRFTVHGRRQALIYSDPDAVLDAADAAEIDQAAASLGVAVTGTTIGAVLESVRVG